MLVRVVHEVLVRGFAAEHIAVEEILDLARKRSRNVVVRGNLREGLGKRFVDVLRIAGVARHLLLHQLEKAGAGLSVSLGNESLPLLGDLAGGDSVHVLVTEDVERKAGIGVAVRILPAVAHVVIVRMEADRGELCVRFVALHPFRARVRRLRLGRIDAVKVALGHVREAGVQILQLGRRALDGILEHLHALERRVLVKDLVGEVGRKAVLHKVLLAVRGVEAESVEIVSRLLKGHFVRRILEGGRRRVGSLHVSPAVSVILIRIVSFSGRGGGVPLPDRCPLRILSSGEMNPPP